MPSLFTEKSRMPTDRALSKALGRTRRHWDEILEFAAEDCEGVTREWKFYGKSHGWTLKLKTKKRALLYMAPEEGCFTASMALGPDALEAVRASDLPRDLVTEIETAKAYPEGKPARVQITNLQHVKHVKKLMALKLAT